MSEIIEVKVPDIGDFQDVEIIEVHVVPGDHINEEDPLITLESDKASMEVPSSHAGTVKVVAVGVGDRVSKGSPVLSLEIGEVKAPVEPPSHKGVQETDMAPPEKERLEADEKAMDEPQTVAQTAQSANEASALETVDEAAMTSVHASPSVRAWARELGADLVKIKGTGPKGRIIREDVTAYVKGVLSKSAAAGSGMGIPPIPEIDFTEFGEIEEVELARIRRISGPFLHRAWLNIPHVTHHDEADITDLDIFRKDLDADAKKEGYRITILSFIMKAVASALRVFPDFNASLTPDGQRLILKKYVNIGIAVDTPGGLVVPVIRDVHKKGIIAISQELAQVSTKARDGKLGPKEMQGGSISISSLGGIGGTAFTPIVNAPEVAILGVTRSRMKPVWDGSDFKPRNMLPLSLSYDHRVIDGALAARFTAYLCQALADARRLLL